MWHMLRIPWQVVIKCTGGWKDDDLRSGEGLGKTITCGYVDSGLGKKFEDEANSVICLMLATFERHCKSDEPGLPWWSVLKNLPCNGNGTGQEDKGNF